MNVRFKKTPGGEVAILPRSDYETLVKKAQEADEDTGTARLVARARKDIAAGEPLIPIDVANRLAAGENPIHVLRRWRRLSQVELSAAVGIVQGYLSDLENGKRKGPVELHAKLARKLGVPVDLLMLVPVLAQEPDPKRFTKRRQVVEDRQALGKAPRPPR
jgi:DNA-binding XRE family transcriptional regulator